jgi:hypothetical protein
MIYKENNEYDFQIHGLVVCFHAGGQIIYIDCLILTQVLAEFRSEEIPLTLAH